MEPMEKLQKPAPSARHAPLAVAPIVIGRFYEVHKYLGGRWELASVFDEKEDAIADAKSMFDGSRYSMGVRVLRVIARQDQNQDVTFVEQTVFRQSAVDEHNVEASARALRAWEEVKAARESRRRERLARPAPKKTRLDRLAIILGLTILAWLVVAAMVAKFQIGVY
ncbi:MAG TPA: hypothetical protein VLX09_16245 [Stellaceae bacterium]|nr:hypothetical protein [Stellaceae bacterium]